MKIIFLILISATLVVPTKAEPTYDLPLLEDGKWTVLITPIGLASSVISQTEISFCTSKKEQPKLMKMVFAEVGCIENTAKTTKNISIIESKCQFVGYQAKVITQIIFANMQSFHGESTLQNNKLTLKANFTSKYEGTCKKGEKPGDYTSTKKSKINLNFSNLQNYWGNITKK